MDDIKKDPFEEYIRQTEPSKRELGYDKFFGRTEVMDELSITASPASELIKKMLNLGVIYPMKGKGKGKYLFVRRHEESD